MWHPAVGCKNTAFQKVGRRPAAGSRNCIDNDVTMVMMVMLIVVAIAVILEIRVIIAVVVVVVVGGVGGFFNEPWRDKFIDFCFRA